MVDILYFRPIDKSNHGEEQEKSKGMEIGMASLLPMEKLDRSNYALWS